MARELLTVKQLESHKGDGVLRDGNGLMLRGSRWVLRDRAHGKRHDLGLGGWPEVGLKQPPTARGLSWTRGGPGWTSQSSPGVEAGR